MSKCSPCYAKIELCEAGLCARKVRAKILAAIALLSAACGPMSDGPLDMHDLQGRWCDETGVCLVVERATYRWSTPTCTEEGALSGALEFDPVLSGLCWFPGQAPSLYSASVYYSGAGITVELASPEGDDGPIVRLEWAL